MAVLKQTELGMVVAGIVRQTGIFEQTSYRWKKACGGLQSDVGDFTRSLAPSPNRGLGDHAKKPQGREAQWNNEEAGAASRRSRKGSARPGEGAAGARVRPKGRERARNAD